MRPLPPINPPLFDGNLESMKPHKDQCYKHHTDIWYSFVLNKRDKISSFLANQWSTKNANAHKVNILKGFLW